MKTWKQQFLLGELHIKVAQCRLLQVGEICILCSGGRVGFQDQDNPAAQECQTSTQCLSQDNQTHCWLVYLAPVLGLVNSLA